MLRSKYGYQTDESRALNPSIKILHTQVNGKDFNTLNGKKFLKLTEKENRIYLEHAEDGIIKDAYWEKEQLEKAFNKKYPAKNYITLKLSLKRNLMVQNRFIIIKQLV